MKNRKKIILISYFILSIAPVHAMEREIPQLKSDENGETIELSPFDRINNALNLISHEIRQLFIAINEAAKKKNAILMEAPRLLHTLDPETKQRFIDRALELFEQNKSLLAKLKQLAGMEDQYLYRHLYSNFNYNEESLNLITGEKTK